MESRRAPRGDTQLIEIRMLRIHIFSPCSLLKHSLHVHMSKHRDFPLLLVSHHDPSSKRLFAPSSRPYRSPQCPFPTCVVADVCAPPPAARRCHDRAKDSTAAGSLSPVGKGGITKKSAGSEQDLTTLRYAHNSCLDAASRLRAAVHPSVHTHTAVDPRRGRYGMHIWL